MVTRYVQILVIHGVFTANSYAPEGTGVMEAIQHSDCHVTLCYTAEFKFYVDLEGDSTTKKHCLRCLVVPTSSPHRVSCVLVLLIWVQTCYAPC